GLHRLPTAEKHVTAVFLAVTIHQNSVICPSRASWREQPSRLCRVGFKRSLPSCRCLSELPSAGACLMLSSSRHRRRPRKGNTFTFGLGSMAIVAVLSLVGWWMFGGVAGDDTPEFLTTTAVHGPYDFVVIEQGTIESARNTEL